MEKLTQQDYDGINIEIRYIEERGHLFACINQSVDGVEYTGTAFADLDDIQSVVVDLINDLMKEKGRGCFASNQGVVHNG